MQTFSEYCSNLNKEYVFGLKRIHRKEKMETFIKTLHLGVIKVLEICGFQAAALFTHLTIYEI